jgi:hypothetical protein
MHDRDVDDMHVYMYTARARVRVNLLRAHAARASRAAIAKSQHAQLRFSAAPRACMQGSADGRARVRVHHMAMARGLRML